MREVTEHQKQLEKVRENYTYSAAQTTQELDSNGQVTKTDTTELEIFYVNGQPIERLVKKDGSGCQWIAIKIGTRGESDQITLQAAEGKFKGWYLDCTEEEEKIEIGGKTYSFRRMILSKKPGRIDYFLRYPVAP